MDVVGSEYKIYIFIFLADLLHYMMFLHHTAKKYDLHIWMTALNAL